MDKKRKIDQARNEIREILEEHNLCFIHNDPFENTKLYDMDTGEKVHIEESSFFPMEVK